MPGRFLGIINVILSIKHQRSYRALISLPDKMGWEGRVGTTGRGSSDRELYFVDLPPRRR